MLGSPTNRPSPRTAGASAAALILVLGLMALSWALAFSPGEAAGQEVRISDLTLANSDIPYRLVGYGLVTGLDGTGDRVIGGFSSGHTVRSITNLLRRFAVEVPENVLRTRNVAAVLVTAEVSPYLRPGGRFTIHVSSLGDAISLRGGVLWMTPLMLDAGEAPVATAQGPLYMSEGLAASGPGQYPVETTGRIPDGGLLERPLPRTEYQATSSLLLREPDLMTATRVADAINASLGEGAARVEDPGSVALDLSVAGDEPVPVTLARIGEIPVARSQKARLVIDGRDGTVVAGGALTVGDAVVSHGSMTLSIGGPEAGDAGVPGDLRMPRGISVQEVASALHAVAAPPQAIAAVFSSLQEVGALSAEVVVR